MVLAGCPDLSTICPNKEITQGVFGSIDDGTGGVEEGVEITAFEIVGSAQGPQIAMFATTRGGFEFNLLASTYMLCAKGDCTNVVVPTGLVEQPGTDTGSGVFWMAPVAVPPAQTIGPCTWGD
ncbi:MAG TPA: hypothetical protein VGG28_09545 [Kofleriaceae bacterium]